MQILKRYDEDVEELRRYGCLVRFSRVYRYFCHGAAEYLLPLCNLGIKNNGKINLLTEEEQMSMLIIAENMASEGLSPIVIAYREIRNPDIFLDPDTSKFFPDPPEEQLICVAILGLRMTPNGTSADTFAMFKNEGIKVRMVCNDHPDSAAYVAAQAGVLYDGQVVTAFDVAELNQLDQFKAYSTGQVFARYSPAEKYSLLRYYQDIDRIVLVSGYKHLDAPTMLQADVSVAMDSISWYEIVLMISQLAKFVERLLESF